MSGRDWEVSVAKLGVFNMVSLDGFIADRNGDMSWAHKDPQDAEWNAFTSRNASGGGVLVFGRVTYDLMVGWWPTPQAAKAMPVVAERMNALEKIVFSRTLEQATWRNTRLIKGDLVAEMRRLKGGPGADMVILGSGSIVGQLAEAGLIDEYRIAVSPVVLGKGKTMFDAVTRKLALRLTGSQTFGNGTVVLSYRPAA
jgi:dihydrofolate reductase